MSQEYTPVQWVDETAGQPGTLINKARLDQMQTAHHYADGFEEVDAVPTADPGVDYHKVVYCTADTTFYRWNGSAWVKDVDDSTLALLEAHEADHNNPHVVTKAQVGLGNCDNTSDLDKPISTAAQAALDAKVDDSQIVNTWTVPLSNDNIPGEKLVKDSLDAKLDDTQIVTAWSADLSDEKIPSEKLVKDTFTQYGILITGAATSILYQDLTPSKAMVSDADGKVAVSSVSTTELEYLTGATGNIQDQIDGIAGDLSDHIADDDNPHGVTAAQVGLGNVDNTSDADKPISDATQTALDDKVDKNESITGGTKCKITYDAKGLVTNGADLTASDIPELAISKITNLQTSLDNKLDDSQLVTSWGSPTSDTKIPSEKLVKGETDAIAGNLSNHTSDTNNPHSVTASQVGLGNCDNTSDLNKPISTATQTALDGKQPTITGAATSITGNNLTASRALISDSNGKVAASSSVSVTELEYLDGVTSGIQGQINGKAPTSHASTATTYGQGDATHYGHVMVDASMDAGSDNPVKNSTIVGFVNSSIATNTANFKGTYDVVSDLGLTESATQAQVITELNAKTSWKVGSDPTNNDYCFVQFDLSSDPGNVDRYDRYKFSGIYGQGGSWGYEYTLNNSSFTQAQWAAINSLVTNSGATGIDVQDILAHIASTSNPHSVTASQVGLGNCDNTSDANKPISTATQTALDGKVSANASITGATKCKITYDSKGLVTAGADLVENDLPSLSIAKTTGLQTALDNKLDDNQLVTSWGSPTSDTKIPSEKLVKDTFGDYLPLTGGTLKGTLNIRNAGDTGNVASIDQNGYITGTWLKTTSASNLNATPTEYAVLSSGWIYKRTADQTKSDLGIDLKAPLASPALTGTPTAPTAPAGTNTTQIATTAFVKTAIDGAPSGTVTNIATGTGLTGGPITTTGTISHATSGVTAGTYQSVTVNAYGHVTAGTNPFSTTQISITEVD